MATDRWENEGGRTPTEVNNINSQHNPAPFFPKLSNTGQRFIPNWPIIRKFN